MRILLITDWNRGRGGAEAYITLLRDGLKGAGHEVRLMTSSVGTAGDGTAEYVAFGSESLASRTFLQIANPFAVIALRRAIEEFRPDVVVVNMFAHQLSPAILRATGSIPIVLMVSDYKCVCPIGSKLRRDASICASQPGWVCCSTGCVSLPHWLRDQPRYALIRSGVAHAARVLACSEYVKRELALSGIDSDCVYLPVHRPSLTYRRCRSTLPRILFSGRLDREKGVDRLLHAFSLSLAENSGAQLRVAGQGPERASLESLARELRITENVEFLGWLEPPRIELEIASAWALAAPSLWPEPLGFVALEAVSRGVPVIASRVGGFAETLEEGVTGILVPNGDVSALSGAIAAVISGRAFQDGVPDEAARRVIGRHDVGSHIKRMDAILTGVVSFHENSRRHSGVVAGV